MSSPPAERWLIVHDARSGSETSRAAVLAQIIRAAARCRNLLDGGRQSESAAGPNQRRRPTIELVTVGDGGMASLPPATGGDDDWLVLIGQECRPEDWALETVRDVVRAHPRVDLVYGDSIVEVGSAAEPELRPGFSPDRLASQDYLGRLLVVRRRVWDAVVGSDHGHAEPWSHQGLIQMAATARSVAHIPRCLYRWAAGGRDGPPASTPRSGPIGRGPGGNGSGSTAPRTRPGAGQRPVVSIIIPTNGARRLIRGRSVNLVDHAVASILDAWERSRGGDRLRGVDIVVVATPGPITATGGQTVDGLRARVAACSASGDIRLRVVPDDRRFNFSNACNRGAVMAGGDVLVFLNDDTEVITADWLDRLTGWTATDGVGAVGARLYYEDGTIQHNGIWSRGGHPVHRYEGYPADTPGHLGSLTVAQNCLAVTGACLAVRADLFERVGGFSPIFPSSYNDVDLCLKLLDLGCRTVVDPGIELFHFEASSRDPSISDEDMSLLHDRWRSVLIDDPFDNPNFDGPGSEELPLPAVEGLYPSSEPDGGRSPVRVWPLEPLALS